MFSKLHSSLPIKKRITELFKRNIEYFRQFLSEIIKRREYLKEHPTMIAVFKCMDGRVHFPYFTKCLIGILKPFRRLGGKFDIGWPHLSDVFYYWVMAQKAAGRSCLAIVSYHFSKGDPKRGCAGFNYDTEAAFKHQLWFKNQIGRVFDREDVYPIVIGLETDADAMILHGEEGRKMDLYELRHINEDALFVQLTELYPDMSPQMLYDLMPLIKGNVEHIKEVEREKRLPIEMEHNEWVIALGSGFDWLHAPNTVIIIGPWHIVELKSEIRIALKIIQSNIREKRIPDDGFVFLISSEWTRKPEDALRAEKVNVLLELAQSVLSEPEFEDIAVKANFITAIVDESKKLTLLDKSAQEYSGVLKEAIQELQAA